MNIQKNSSQVSAVCQAWQQQGLTIAFIPTMGNLHAGHLALVKKAKQVANKVVVSIFVNPLQFAENEDFSEYPRTLDQDIEQLISFDVDLLFTPSINDIYPEGMGKSTFVEVPGLSAILCGEFRPIFFRGVTTIVNKLFNIVNPDTAIFGKKDYQQLIIIKRMVHDLNMRVNIIGEATMRESNGLALSSRNQYLSSAERDQAVLLFSTLNEIKLAIGSGARNFADIERQMSARLQQASFKIDYISIRDAENLGIPDEMTREVVILVAAWLGQTRLIDNLGCSLN